MRRFLPAAAALALLAFQAQAQTTDQSAPAALAAPAPAPATPPAATGTPMMQKPMAHQMSHRMSLQQRFDAANTSHDGKLTKDQAAAAKWPWVDRNFDAMDKDHKGYVTVEDLHNFSHMRHAQMHATPAAAQPQTPPAQSAPAPAAPAPAAPAAPTTQPTQ